MTRRRWPLRPLALAVAASLLLGLDVAPVGAADGCSDPPEIVPVEDLTPGTTGTAWTVVEGSDPVSFDVEILGVLPDGIAPGIDFVLIQVSGPVIDEVGGIAAGMSGSPVYVDGKLAGAIAYGFFAADQTVGGMTPAEPMIDIFSYPDPGSVPAPARTVAIGRELRSAVSRATGTPLEAVDGTAEVLPLPLGVSGISGERLALLEEFIAERGDRFVVTRAGRAPIPSSAGGPKLQPGDAFGAAFSFGDMTFGAIGTATAVCDDRVVAFGHPFTFEGETGLAMTGADILKTVSDPSHLFGPFKIGTITGTKGTVTQDRLTGVMGLHGLMPDLVPIRSDFSTPDLPHEREGETQVAYANYLPIIAYYHILFNLDVVHDRIGDGSVRMAHTIAFTDEDGVSYEIAVDDLYQNDFDASFEAAYRVYIPLYILQFNPFKEVTFESVEASGFITREDLRAEIETILSASGLRPHFQERAYLPVRPGGRIYLRVVLDPFDSDEDAYYDMTLRVPGGASGSGRVVVRGKGRGGDEFFFHDSFGSWEELIDGLSSYTPSYRLNATLSGVGYRRTSVDTDYIPRGAASLAIRVVRG
jgi:hypothetical protein